MTGADTDIISVVRSQFHATPPDRIGVAVSGGGDSVALLHILTRAFPAGTIELQAVTVNHGLRPEALQEAETVAALAERLDIPHVTLTWEGWDRQGNLQAAARDARYRLIADWARERRITQVALGHTADDQAETVLMRLARASGVNGLAAMPVRRTMHGVTLLRPMLGVSRAQLRDYLRRNGISWCEDPSNEDSRFERVQARRILEQLEPLGLTARSLAAVASHMAEAREALDWHTFLTARDIAAVDGGDVVVDLRRFRTLPREIARRLLLCAVMWIGRTDYPPRRAAMTEAIDALRHGRGATLAGCRILVAGSSIWICREYAFARAQSAAPGELWDGRWRLTAPAVTAAGAADRDDLVIGTLGRTGLGQTPGWRETGRPYAALMASPAVWRGEELVAAPLAGMANGWHANLQESPEAFFAALLSN
ncbi:tRNA lysidine(34) synthetase TilS [Marinibacterium profundimaris]|uniref:tRNA lysidine(34) synthetase TilS n=1 Tax=Marinibacterium profundimaris TaxID=1679460 RepID=UPI000B520111|nr:tRNA lysidine(34) synthetase TilS [Marinibacterium profundimaris]